MPYKRPNQGAKKFLPAYGNKNAESHGGFNPGYGFDPDHGGDFISAPLPNEIEGSRRPWGAGAGFKGLNKVLNFLRERITIEEIILIGLIILLLDESIEDELLLIILVYILLF